MDVVLNQVKVSQESKWSLSVSILVLMDVVLNPVVNEINRMHTNRVSILVLMDVVLNLAAGATSEARIPMFQSLF